MITLTHQREVPFADRPDFKELVALLDDPRSDLLWYHQLGEKVEHLVPRRDRKYGDGQMETLEEELAGRMSKNQLWDVRAFYGTFSRSEVRTYAKLALARDFELTWSHLTHIKSIDDEKLRTNILMRCIKKKWSSNELRRQIKAALGRRSQGGRKFERPATLDAALLQMIEECDVWQGRWKEVWFNPDLPLSTLEPGSKSKERLSHSLVSAIAKLEQISDAITRELPGLQRLKKTWGKEAKSRSKISRAKK